MVLLCRKTKFVYSVLRLLDFNPLVPEGPPFEEQNHLALDRVKSISHYWALKG